MLYKPLSFGNGATGTLADATATTFLLGSAYYPLQADGTLGAAVTSITLRNGEGAILVPVPALSPPLVTGPSPRTAAGASGSVTVASAVPSGHAAPGHTGAVNFTGTAKAAWLPADYTFAAAAAGQHTFTNGVTLRAAGAQTVTAPDRDSSITGSAVVQALKRRALNWLYWSDDP